MVTDIDHDRAKMHTACLLHFNGGIPSVICFVRGPFTAAYRDLTVILNNIQPYADRDLYSECERILKCGTPSYCNATSTDANLRAYIAYGNHSSAHDDIAKTKKSIVKDARPGYLAYFGWRMAPFIRNLHVCPIGVTDLNHPTKKPRPYFDGSCHVLPSSFTINDWVDTATEPGLIFPYAFMTLLVWIWALRITYPFEEIYWQTMISLTASAALSTILT